MHSTYKLTMRLLATVALLVSCSLVGWGQQFNTEFNNILDENQFANTGSANFEGFGPVNKFESPNGGIVYLKDDGRGGIAFGGNLNDPGIIEVSEYIVENIGKLTSIRATARVVDWASKRQDDPNYTDSRINVSYEAGLIQGGTYIANLLVESRGFIGDQAYIGTGTSFAKLFFPEQVTQAALFADGIGGYNSIPGVELPDGVSDLLGRIPIIGNVIGIGEEATQVVESVTGDGSGEFNPVSIINTVDYFYNNIDELFDGATTSSVLGEVSDRVFVDVTINKGDFDFGNNVRIAPAEGTKLIIPGIDTEGLTIEPVSINGGPIMEGTAVPLGIKSSKEQLANQLKNSADAFYLFGEEVEIFGGGNKLNGIILGNDEAVVEWIDNIRALHDAEFTTITNTELSRNIAEISVSVVNGGGIPKNITSSGNVNQKFAPLGTSFIAASYSLFDEPVFDRSVDVFTVFRDVINDDLTVVGSAAKNSDIFYSDVEYNTSNSDIAFTLDNSIDLNKFKFGIDYQAPVFEGATFSITPSSGAFRTLAESKDFGLHPAPDVVVHAPELAENNFLASLIEKHQLAGPLVTTAFQEALATSRDHQGVELTDQPWGQRETDLQARTYQAACEAKQQLHSFIDQPAPLYNLSAQWTRYLEEQDDEMFSAITAKINDFNQEQTAADQPLVLLPQIALRTQVTPVLPVAQSGSDVSVDFDQLDYRVDLQLTNATLRLGYYEDCAQQAELGVVLNEEELAFLKTAWAADTDQDGTVDQGFVLWVQQQLKAAQRALSRKMTYGTTPAFAAYNEIVFSLGVAELYKHLHPKQAQRLSPPGTVSTSTTLQDQHLSISSSSDRSAKHRQRFDPTASEIVWRPVELLGLDSAQLHQKPPPEAHVASRVTNANANVSIDINGANYFNSDGEMASDVPHFITVTIRNTGSSPINNNDKVAVTVTEDRDVGIINTGFFTVNLGPNETKTYTINYTPTYQGPHTFEVRDLASPGTILASKRVLVRSVASQAVDFNTYCNYDRVARGVVEANTAELEVGQTVRSHQKVRSGGTLTIRATQSVELATGFRAEAGSNVSILPTNCSGLRSTLAGAIDN